MNNYKIIEKYFKHVFWKSYYNLRLPNCHNLILPNFYIVTYTISNSKNNKVRNIVKKVLKDNGYICLYSKLNIKYIDYNLRDISLANYEKLYNFEKKRLLAHITIELLNNINNKHLLECLKQIEFDIIMI